MRKWNVRIAAARAHVSVQSCTDRARSHSEYSESVFGEGLTACDTQEHDEQEGRKRMRTNSTAETSREWFPWNDRITCTLDILMHLPRSVFSQKQLDLFLWLLKINGVHDVPSVTSMLQLNSALQRTCGIETIGYDGALGHKYFVNNLAQIIAQEMSNPLVRPHLHFYPEDGGVELSEARQAARWLHELPGELTTPVARINDTDYYIYEPVMLRSGEFCMPFRWFTRKDGAGKQQLHAQCWSMASIANEGSACWRVIEDEVFEVSHSDLLQDFVALKEGASRYGMPSPSRISGIYNRQSGQTRPWTLTDPEEGNKWRAKSKGYRTYAFPVWMYCDDTSGNVSKKWNKHNSFLFTPAGLSRSEVHKEYNVHFLATSNIAPPLEMLDGIVEQLHDAQENGIWAWDYDTKEPVLLIPSVLALLGDNPMQSEFACHIGLRGKLFCRMCWVKGESDTHLASPPTPEGIAETPTAPVVPASSKRKSRGAKKVAETASALLARLRTFIKPGKARKKQETVEQLRSTFVTASTTVNKKTALENQRTETGIKDTYQLHFMESLFASYNKKRGRDNKLAALSAKVSKLPSNTMSPVWRIHGLDPHSDTPVEILHVVLLGFVKYFWRDLIQNQLKKKDNKKELLKTRLSSLDVSGLGISELNGHTLVQYAGSLTGRDFRAIAQVAPFVIYDMVSSDCYEAWLALSKLVPLIWQPEILDIRSYLPLLEVEIRRFLLCTARWSSQWFNKPKFHILVHLPDHIRRFGPAILFATEAFESFNAVIRAKSVHSNRHAPSRDIALAFAQGNRIRHLMAGGYIAWAASPASTVSKTESTVAAHEKTMPPYLPSLGSWRTTGPGPKRICARPSTATRYLGLTDERGKPRVLPTAFADSSKHQFRTCTDYVLENGDRCTPGQFVIVRASPYGPATYVAAVREIIQLANSPEDYARTPSGVLVELADVDTTASVSCGMPSLTVHQRYAMVSASNLLCTVNTQHRCVAHQCQPTGVHVYYEEGDKSRPRNAARILHKKDPHDLLLNTAQMRDAKYLQRYRIVSGQDLDTEENVLTASSMAEVDRRKKDALGTDLEGGSAVANTTARGRGGRGKGRGRPRGRALRGRGRSGQEESAPKVGEPRRLAEIRG
ncbi:hypothetical protein EV714DRAFT_219219 [Schizophyllum commune]